jgi:site-specific DNA-methyltransferase (adenine-specific)
VLEFGYYNMDCMEGMKQFPDKYFDIAVVDPPYFKGPEKRGHFGRKVSPIGVKRYFDNLSTWEVPGDDYFIELFRVSKHQIIWGCNYFEYQFGSGRIVWDKCNGASSFSDAEIAYCSTHDSVRLFRYMWNGMFQGKSISEGHIQRGNKSLNELKIHQTQKPVDLYKWIIMNYIEKGSKGLDTHTGSASSLIAYYDEQLPYVAFERDKLMYDKSKKRLEDHMAQMSFQIDFGL